MSINFFNQLIIGILFPIIIGIFTIYSSIYGYIKSDSFKKTFFPRPLKSDYTKFLKGLLI